MKRIDKLGTFDYLFMQIYFHTQEIVWIRAKVSVNIVASDLFDLDVALDKLEVEDDVIAREIKIITS